MHRAGILLLPLQSKVQAAGSPALLSGRQAVQAAVEGHRHLAVTAGVTTAQPASPSALSTCSPLPPDHYGREAQNLPGHAVSRKTNARAREMNLWHYLCIHMSVVLYFLLTETALRPLLQKPKAARLEIPNHFKQQFTIQVF